ncbi:MAG: HEAT repeat domain-containing protein, partial [Candidatus Saganbacteria bacterium]|nr:HEAT repeat domain-containing protein [Candidatus Saganbacteria bacterium]
MGLWCNGVDDTSKKLQLDFVSSRQRLFKRLGFIDRNNNGVIDAKKNNSLNRLIRAQEGYGDYNRVHPADTNKDKKINENEAWNYYYLRHKSLVSDTFLLSEIKGKGFKKQKEFLDKIAAYLKGSHNHLAKFLAATLQIGIDGKNMELTRYVFNYLIGCIRKYNGIHPIVKLLAKWVRGLEQIETKLMLRKIILPYLKPSVSMNLKKLAKLNLLIAPVLNITLKDRDFRIRGASAGVFLEINVFKNNDERKKMQACYFIGNQLWGKVEKLGVFSIPALARTLQDKDENIRSKAARSLGKIGTRHPSAIPILFVALKDRASVVKVAAAYALGEIGHSSAISALTVALKDKDSVVRAAVADALGEIGHPSAIPALAAALKDRYRVVRVAAAYALGKIGHPSAIPALFKALDEGRFYWRGDVRHSVMFAAAKALVKIGSASIPALFKVLRHRSGNKLKLAAMALMEIGSASIPALSKAIGDNDSNVRAATVEALGGIKNPRTISALYRVLRDRDSDVRRAAAEALIKIAVFKNKSEREKVQAYVFVADKEWEKVVKLGKSAIPALYEAFRDGDSDVRGAAAETLIKINIFKKKSERERMQAYVFVADKKWEKAAKLGKSAIPALSKAIGDEYSDVSAAAAEALGKIKDPGAVPALSKALG